MATTMKHGIINRMADYFGYDYEVAARNFAKANKNGGVITWAEEFGIEEAAEYAEYKAGGWSPLGDELESARQEFVR